MRVALGKLLGQLRGKLLLLFWAISLLMNCRPSAAADASSTVRLKYDTGETEVDQVKSGVKFSTIGNFLWDTFPAEIGDLSFTRRARRDFSALTIDASSGGNLYFIFGAGPEATENKAICASIGGVTCGEARITGRRFLIYKVVLHDPLHTTIQCSKRGLFGFAVAAASLSVDPPAQAPAKKPGRDADASLPFHSDPVPDIAPIAGPSTRPVNSQATITALEVYEREHGMMLGQTSEATLTLTPSTTPKLTAVRFVTKVGDDMCLARDEALRYIRLTYPNWDVSKAEISFEDKYVAHDGGSIGTAIGTMILSCIQGFAIDPDVAITGDISANGKVRAIGGVSAKLKGAIANKCKLVAIPTQNLDQLVDAVVYGGPQLVNNIQVLGISSLEDAVTVVRTDREAKLKKAIDLFAEVQQSLVAKATDIKTRDIQDKLEQVLSLSPNHLSAQILLSIAQGKQPKTLSATASQYYTFLSVGNMLDALKERSGSNATHSVPSSLVRDGLANLRKLRPLADAGVRPLIDAWSRFIEALNAVQVGIGSPQNVEEQRQSLLDEMAKQDADADLMQKRLKEGM